MIEAIVILLLSYPGAFIRWLFVRKKRRIKDIVKDDEYINAGITIIVFIIIFTSIYLVKVITR
jgi:uncharacterized Tic20 family protein